MRVSLNALSGIGCVRTQFDSGGEALIFYVLMPCRALGAFGLLLSARLESPVLSVLMPCRALGAFGRRLP